MLLFIGIGITGPFPEGRAFSGTFPGAFPGQSGSAEQPLPAGAPGSPQEFHQRHLEGIKPTQHSFIGFPASIQSLGNLWEGAPRAALGGCSMKSLCEVPGNSEQDQPLGEAWRCNPPKTPQQLLPWGVFPADPGLPEGLCNP